MGSVKNISPCSITYKAPIIFPFRTLGNHISGHPAFLALDVTEKLISLEDLRGEELIKSTISMSAVSWSLDASVALPYVMPYTLHMWTCPLGRSDLEKC